MTSIFDGMAGALNSVFGAPVTIYTDHGQFEVNAILRDTRVEVMGDEGESVLTITPMLHIQSGDLNGLRRGDSVMNAQGTRYVVLHRNPAESPASDRFETFALRKEEQ